MIFFIYLISLLWIYVAYLFKCFMKYFKTLFLKWFCFKSRIFKPQQSTPLPLPLLMYKVTCPTWTRSTSQKQKYMIICCERGVDWKKIIYTGSISFYTCLVSFSKGDLQHLCRLFSFEPHLLQFNLDLFLISFPDNTLSSSPFLLDVFCLSIHLPFKLCLRVFRGREERVLNNRKIWVKRIKEF